MKGGVFSKCINHIYRLLAFHLFGDSSDNILYIIDDFENSNIELPANVCS